MTMNPTIAPPAAAAAQYDVAALQSHQFKRPLKPLEHGIGRIVFFAGIRHGSHTEEKRQSLGCGHEEDAGADNHHD